jgi:hypothetical protein
MAVPGLIVDLNTLRTETGIFLGWGRSHGSYTANNNTDFTYIHKRAMRRFYYPPLDGETPYYEWSFLRKTGTITLLTDDWDYDLPEDFGGTILDRSVTYNTAGTAQPPLHKVDEQVIRHHRTNKVHKGYPRNYAVRPKAHAPTTGQRWELLVDPQPNATVNSTKIDFRYVYVPDHLSGSNIYPAGGAQYGEVLLAAHLAEAELFQENDPEGAYGMKFQQMLGTAIRNDMQQKQNNRGGRA